jgi:hypothetical protein
MTVSLLSSRRHVGSMTVLACVTWIPRSSTISGSGTRITLGLRRLAATVAERAEGGRWASIPAMSGRLSRLLMGGYAPTAACGRG